MKAVSFFFFCFLFLISFVFLFKCLIFFSGALKETFLAYISEPLKNLPQIELKKEEVFPPEINAKSAISIQIFPNGKERVLFQKNPEDPLPIASLTKLMTALVVLENPQIYDLKNTKIQISERAANQKNSPYCGNLDSMVGEKFDVKTLLDLSLICSSNDAAFALSELIGTERFVEKMNQEAQKIGLKNTYFFNPHG
ncbi:D-alanyl-D-alanine carboxypeptidase, partial [Candidatus Parcubacteria bacterium]|nr:D-alanyl-D-alanine carboxypeptidase [Candidatus Parcubacteria bacterium]